MNGSGKLGQAWWHGMEDNHGQSWRQTSYRRIIYKDIIVKNGLFSRQMEFYPKHQSEHHQNGSENPSRYEDPTTKLFTKQTIWQSKDPKPDERRETEVAKTMMRQRAGSRGNRGEEIGTKQSTRVTILIRTRVKAEIDYNQSRQSDHLK